MHNVVFDTLEEYELKKDSIWKKTAEDDPLRLKYPSPNYVVLREEGEPIRYRDIIESTISATVENGSIAATDKDGAAVALPYTGKEGDKLTLEVTPNDGYTFAIWSDWKMQPKRDVFVDICDRTYKALCIKTGMLLAVTAENGTVEAKVNGVVTALPASVKKGASVELAFTPDEGYAFEVWKKNGVEISINNPYRFIITEDTILDCEGVKQESNYLTFEGKADAGGLETIALLIPTFAVIGAGLEYSTEDVPTTWKPAALTEDTYLMPSMEELMRADYNKLHVRAKDGGNTKVCYISIVAKKISGPILSMLDNTCSITSMPTAAFYATDVGAGFMGTQSQVEDLSGLKFPTFASPYCYTGFAMASCQYLRVPPAELPAVEPQVNCYMNMFANCELLQGTINVKMSNYKVEAGPEEWYRVCDSMGQNANNLTLSVPSEGYDWAQYAGCHVIDPNGEYWPEG